ncbi:MAG: CPBP family intramembrane metalloprotease [Candidatus Bathyarchaeota archaeon]|nr:MAG: CPBP family intramembrane metalloprotease [Candidatus Bathyarchaeota archaeon]
MNDQSKWKAKPALLCYFALIGGLLVGAIILEVILLGMGITLENSPFPVTLIGTPINEFIILGVTLLFAGRRGASFKELGLRRVSLKVLILVSVLAGLLFLIGLGISIGEEIILGPDPTSELFAKLVMPRDSLQLIGVLVFQLVLVGPCEELAFRGFVQRGFENSFGRMRGLLVASVLFALVHGLNTLYAIVPVFVGGLILGYVWQQTGGNTTASAVMHGINNSISITIAYLLAG